LIKLFCFPHAGGSSVAYWPWKRYLDPQIDLIPIELPGHGKRYKSPFCKTFQDAVDDLYHQMQPYLSEQSTPYAMFGHSLGSLLVYGVVERIKKTGLPMPCHIFFSGRFPPHIKKTALHTYSDKELLDTVLSYEGTPSGIIKNPYLYEMFLEVLKADIRLIETFTYKPRSSNYQFPISVLGGNEDTDLKEDELNSFRDYTDKSCSIYRFSGGHFFLKDHLQEVTSLINETLIRSLFTEKLVLNQVT
jgi:medium-chain acyl-[acyl-carrier-protein] hydrolase